MWYACIRILCIFAKKGMVPVSANRKGLSVTERHVLRSVAIAVLFVLSGVLCIFLCWCLM